MDRFERGLVTCLLWLVGSLLFLLLCWQIGNPPPCTPARAGEFKILRGIGNDTLRICECYEGVCGWAEQDHAPGYRP